MAENFHGEKYLRDFFYNHCNKELCFNQFDEFIKIFVKELNHYLHDVENKHEKTHKSKVLRKNFIQELYPLHLFLNKSYKKDSITIEIKNGNKNHDAVLREEGKETFIEITYPRDGEQDLYFRKHLDKFKRAPLTDDISTKSLKNTIENNEGLSHEFELVSEKIKEGAKEINKILEKKANKNYDPETILLVCHNIRLLIRDRTQKLCFPEEILPNKWIFLEMTNIDYFHKHIKIPVNNKFREIYLVGLLDDNICDKIYPKTQN